MAAIDFGLNGRPRSFRKPCAASSADMARRLSLPPLGFLRASAFASLTTSGRASIWLLRPSTFSPVAIRLRLRAAASLATRVVFSNSATAPKTWRTRTAVGVSSMKCVGADAATREIRFEVPRLSASRVVNWVKATLQRPPPPPRFPVLFCA
jgi:hypothetical protein